MSKKNRIRYSSNGNPYPPVLLTGNVFLRHRDQEMILTPQKGDLQVYLSTDGLLGAIQGDYEMMGHVGYLKADVFDGKNWCPVSLEEFFANREYYFGKRERPADTYAMCENVFKAAAGTKLIRIYREHYVKVEED